MKVFAIVGSPIKTKEAMKNPCIRLSWCGLSMTKNTSNNR